MLINLSCNDSIKATAELPKLGDAYNCPQHGWATVMRLDWESAEPLPTVIVPPEVIARLRARAADLLPPLSNPEYTVEPALPVTTVDPPPALQIMETQSQKDLEKWSARMAEWWKNRPVNQK